MIVLILILIPLHCLLFYNRQIRFYRQPYSNEPINPKNILSCVEGTVVYINKVTDQDSARMIKGRRSLEIPTLDKGEYYHIGIYMSPYNNHHLLTPEGILPKIDMVQGEYLPMLSNFEPIFPFLWSMNWYSRKINNFISYNQRYIMRYNRSVVMVMIMDKFVNKISIIGKPIGGRKIIGFVHRGSQLDVFMPTKNYTPQIQVGDKVNYDTTLAVGKWN